MNVSIRRHACLAFLAGFVTTVLAAPASAAIDIAPRPLFLGTNVPGHLVLVPSVEFPTVITRANLGDYSRTATYAGYFDSGKCYEYRWAVEERDRHFFPTRFVSGNACDRANEWSGHYLNWAATQTIDPFRSALTGGLRVRDTPTETWLQKARHFRNSNFANLTISEPNVAPATPASWTRVQTRVRGLSERLRFTANGNLDSPALLVAYNPAVHTLDGGTYAAGDVNFTPVGGSQAPTAGGNRADVVYEVSVRVAVCVPDLLEANCVPYAQGWKPEGLIQEYAGRGSAGPNARPRLKYSIFGYLNIDGSSRDGGVMRARSKYVGPTLFNNLGQTVPNPAAEWDPTTGVLYANPDPADATATNTAAGLTGANQVVRSGVINYLNQFGEVFRSATMKSQDPVSELYYAALRYLKNQRPVPEYSNNLGTGNAAAVATDGFPVITDWDDPMPFRCQSNVMLGIGDTNTWQDKNLPGPTNSTNEPTKPALVTADTTVNVVDFMNLIRTLEAQEGNNLAAANAAHFSISGHHNSAYIAALAYHANTQDIRPDLADPQTVQTFWVDVQEDGFSDPRNANMYWLATKYGGFRPPQGFDPLTRTTPLPTTLWNSTGELISTDFRRPDTYFPAGDANRMVSSLQRAFQNIVRVDDGSGASFATNTTRLEAGARVYQASFDSGRWSGELDAFTANELTGRLSDTPVWSASVVLGQSPFTARDLWVNSNGYRPFNSFSALAPADQAVLQNAQRMDYIRGDRSNEGTTGLQFRARSSALGTFVNSQPVFVGRPDPRLYAGAGFTGASAYAAHAAAQANRTPMIYVGSNGGFLHAFNANNGTEEYAFMPNGVLRNQIGTLADANYTHRYQVDGDPVVAEVFDTSVSPNRWRTILVGTMGRGGRNVFALDITNPASVEFLWEVGPAEVPALGNALARPVIAQVADGDWRVIMGNGVNGSGSAELVMIRAVGAGRGQATTIRAVAGSANGLTGVAVSDTDGDSIADAAYGGDYAGNVWKFTNLGSTPSATRFFTALSPSNVAQPISAAPRVARNPADDSIWVFFGTGSYLNENDLGSTQIQTWYGLRDEGATIAGRGDLVDVDIVAEGVVNGRRARVVELVAASEIQARSGWFIDLVSPDGVARGERMVEPNVFQGLTLLGTTRIPDTRDLCAPGGSGWVMAIDPFTGGRRLSNFFDVSGDGQINDSDNLNGAPVSGIGFDSAPNNPNFLGRVMQVSLDDRTRQTVLTDAGAGQPRRVSWREIVNE